MDENTPALPERPDRGRLRYWARLVKLLRDPRAGRSTLPARFFEPSRSPEPPRHPASARFDDEA